MTSAVVSGLSQLQPRREKSAPPSLSELTVFCDFDGPIVDVSERYYKTYQLGLADVQAAYQAQGMTLPLTLLSKSQFWQMKQNRSPDPEIAMRSGLRDEQIEAFLERVGQIVNQPVLLHEDRLQPDVPAALSLLHSQGVRLVLVTLRCEPQVTQILQSYGLIHLFDEIRGTQDCAIAYKNFADHKTQLLAEVISDRDQQHQPAWMIGDTEADILAGQAAGLPTIALTCGIRSQSYLQKFDPTRIHSDLLSAAYYLADWAGYGKGGRSPAPLQA